MRFNSHRDFLSKYIQEKLDPKGLETTHEPTIYSFDQDFVDNWYINLKQHRKSIVFREWHIVARQNEKN